MFRALVLLSLLLVISCSSKLVSDQSFYSIYLELTKSIATNNVIQEREKYFTESYLSQVDVDDEKSLFLLKLPGYLKTIDSHHDLIKGDFGCLSVNGFDEEGGAATLDIEFVNQANNWLVNFMYLNLIEDKNKFRKKAVCPKKS